MHIVGLTGSLRKSSFNTGLLRAVGKILAPGSNTIAPFGKVTYEVIVPDLPLYNQDVDVPGNPALKSATEFRRAIKNADAFIIASPEYNYSMSGALKNALDWGSRGPDGNVFGDKAAAVIGAGGGVGTVRSQNHFRDSALGLNLHVLNHPHVLLRVFDEPHLFDPVTGDVKDAKTEQALEKFVAHFLTWSQRVAPK
jgi:NAD(P)H-dependent FMN reductase|eukprot:gene10574-7524_t